MSPGVTATGPLNALRVSFVLLLSKVQYLKLFLPSVIVLLLAHLQAHLYEIWGLHQFWNYADEGCQKLVNAFVCN